MNIFEKDKFCMKKIKFCSRREKQAMRTKTERLEVTEDLRDLNKV